MGGASHVTTRVMGTYGYAAPEYVATGHLSDKSDVHGFGVVLVEMLTGLRAIDHNRPTGQCNLVDWLRPCLSDRKKVMRIMDPQLDVVQSLDEIQAINCRPKEFRTSTRHLPAHKRSLLHINGSDRAQLLVATEIVGQSVHKTVKLIFHYLMDPMIGMIGIHSMGGIGKTMTMMNINAQLVVTVAFDRIIWVTVSKVLSLDDVQNEIAKQLNASLPVDVAKVRRASILRKIPSVENLKALRFLNLRGTSIKELPEGMETLIRLRFLDLSETKNLVNIREGVTSSLWGLEELHLQGSRLCKMDTPQAANSLKEIRCLTQLQILTLSAVGFGDHLDTIMCLQEQNLVNFSIDIYGSVEDVVDGVKDI
ncbi:hypothetical protein IFM89_024281 [Coptis chinensis]|uniref:Protein kinase domain-containing protein n=1 Tax=Coptis chinensis TaxID=261450 RepID=A0A835HPF8_9MAGN|nr:hypothetical protein IFM89_024281 [Coptis chinensis]